MKQATQTLTDKQKNDIIMTQREFDERVGDFQRQAEKTKAEASRKFMLMNLERIKGGIDPEPFPDGMATFEVNDLSKVFKTLMFLYAEDDAPEWSDRIKTKASRILSRREF